MDIGAGVGTELLAFSKLVGPTGRVICIEADPVAFRLLTKLKNILGLTNVTLLQIAVGDSKGFAYMQQDGPASLANQIVASDSSCEENAPKVAMDTLDSLVESLGLDRVDFIKINIEGAETAALSGFEKHAPLVKNWCVSCHDFLGPKTATFETVSEWFSERGLGPTRHPADPSSACVAYYLYGNKS
jgi:FkbM family methyltransferase